MTLGKSLSFLGKSFVDDKDRFKKIIIEDLPVLLCEDGSICCIPKGTEVFSSAIAGGSGTGKTLLANRMISGLYWQWKVNVAILNDVSEETYKWSEPMSCKEFNNFNKCYLNQTPVPSPLTYVYPNTNTLELDREKLKTKSYVRVVMPFKEVVNNLQFYLAGVNRDFELGKSGSYVSLLSEELAECESPSQVKEVLNSGLPGSDGKSFQAMRIKILTAFENLLKEEILDVTNPECHAYLRLHKPKFISNPLSVLMKAGAIPSLVTSDLVGKKYKGEIFSYFINAIFENNTEDFPGEQTYLFFDELKDVCESDADSSARAIGRVAQRGRIKNVGLIYATQFYSKIPKSVKGAKLNYCFAFQHSDSKIIDEIGRDFDLERDVKKQIKTLKKFEVIGMTNTHFVFYRGREKWIDDKPVRGQIFFPLANHHHLGEEKNEK